MSKTYTTNEHSMKNYFVYILKCNDNSFYTGVTNNLEQRIEQHSSGIKKDSYTYKRRPVTLVWNESFNEIGQAILWEKKIKAWSRRKKIALIEGNWDDLILFSKNYTQFGNKIEK